MKAKIIDGKEVSQKIKTDIKDRVENYKREGRRQPCLAVILAGEDPASAIYVRNKQKACEKCGILSVMKKLPEDVTREQLIKEISELNSEPTVDGILLQLPLPKHLKSAEAEIIELISPDKDVDGFHPINIGRLALGLESPVACTPSGVIRLIEETGLNMQGKSAVIIGRSNTVGKPLIQLLLQKNATVTVAHSKTTDLPSVTSQADILIAAVGRANMVTESMVKEGAVVIDVGINRLDNGKVTGDVDFDSVSEKAAWLTKVPGGVGPMTIAMLLENTLFCYENHEAK